jgi:membrane-associated protease RseP (regulator of RpoE activity)
MFVDPAAGDFRVRDGSPALAMGFKNFPMDQFGVKKASLKAIAKTPEIPALRVVSRTAAPEEQTAYWLGARLHSLTGEEFSAFGVSKDDGGVQLVDVPAGSAAAEAGFLKSDLLQGLNGIKITKAADLFAALIKLGDAPLTASVIRNQQPLKLEIPNAPYLLLEAASQPAGLMRLSPPAPGASAAVASRQTANEPLATLTDGVIAANYGPVFPNGTIDGAYKLDLGSGKPVSAISTWSYGQNGRRDRQLITVFGSASESDPGWKTDDRAVFTPLGTIDTGSVPTTPFLATSLRSRAGGSLGTFRWIVWRVAPVTSAGENTAFQELAVETVTP